LAGLRLPTLLIVGAHDAISPPEEMRGIADAIPGASLRIIEGAGHMAPMENPDAVNRAIADFLAG
jgi:pimeloyl-ACP methyl ester carboxylesterase